MITREQIEILDTRISGILETVSDLKYENSRLTSELEKEKLTIARLNAFVEEKIKESERLREDLESKNIELEKLKIKEDEMESLLVQVISKVDTLSENSFSKSIHNIIEAKKKPVANKDLSPASFLSVDYSTESIKIEEVNLEDFTLDTETKDLDVLIQED